MTRPKNEKADRPGNMIRTLLILCLAIILEEICTGNLKWQWTLLMLSVIIFASLFKAIVVQKQKAVTGASKKFMHTSLEH